MVKKKRIDVFWQKRRQIKLEKKNRRRKAWIKLKNKNRRNGIGSSYAKRIRNKSAKELYRIDAPEKLDLIYNPVETSDFFADVLRFANKNSKSLSIFFNFERTKHLSVDAIIYLLAIIKDFQKMGLVKHQFSGNYPKDEDARRIFFRSGFLNYMRVKNPSECFPVSDAIQIISGVYYQQEVIRNICEFICEKSNYDRISVKFVYNIISEMMLNTFQHAYDRKENNNKTNNWMLYLEKTSDSFCFNFLDTGMGIVSTVKRKFGDFIKNDCDILKSTINGEFRTNTNKGFRGKGIPKIRNYVRQGNLQELEIIANRAFCHIDNTKEEISSILLDRPLKGTLYHWELKCVEEENDKL